MPAGAASGGEHLGGALLQQVLHELAAFLERDNDAHAEQLAPGVLATTAEHLHGNDPFLGAALGRHAQEAALAAVVAIGGPSGHCHRGGDPFINDRAVGFVVVRFIVGGVTLEAVPVNAGAQLAAFLIGDPMLVHRPARAIRLNGRNNGAQVEYVGVRVTHGCASSWQGH
ncbi:hypothetical protein D3C84_794340 [compost metagenome]